MWGKIGRAGLNAIKDWANERGVLVTPAIMASLQHVQELLRMKPSREYMLGLSVWPRFLAASDAAWEGGRGSGGYLLVLGPRAPVEKRFGCAAQLDPDVYTVWGPQETYIAQFELHMVFVGMLQFASGIRGRRGIWFIDNIAALMALVRGRSNSESLDSLARAVHAAAYA